MPRQFYKLNDFSGGLNLIRDARDIASNELTQADNISLSVAGSIKSSNQIRSTNGGDFSPVDVYTFPGGGVFAFETDRTGVSSADDTGEFWTAAVDSRTGLLSLEGDVTGDRDDVADMGTIYSTTYSANDLQFLGNNIMRRAGSYDFSTITITVKHFIFRNFLINCLNCIN